VRRKVLFPPPPPTPHPLPLKTLARRLFGGRVRIARPRRPFAQLVVHTEPDRTTERRHQRALAQPGEERGRPVRAEQPRDAVDDARVRARRSRARMRTLDVNRLTVYRTPRHIYAQVFAPAGDKVLAIEGMLSGTLSWLFNRFDGSQPFSELVKKAHAQGYTEPDPRDDLDGRDVARKLVILARECGHALNLEDVAVESLVPSDLLGIPLADFWQRLADWDVAMAERYRVAQAQNAVLRYVAHLQADGGAQVKLCALPRKHDFARTRGTDNVLHITSKRYCDNPRVIQGPGARLEVTAAGVFADVLKVAANLPRGAESPFQANAVAALDSVSSSSLSVGGRAL